ncbi:uncharacterized protein LOC120420868 [Culex pipiens pallens]|uniref:uncharacterized protein LOC120420868 n=1 Tax=Culex pipiens pallens TaxID=42434 RepID=UPI0019540B8C|nr:uncharacterized protein LOC120420868 [Culex pipiens pallens]
MARYIAVAIALSILEMVTCTVRFSNLSYELNPEYIKGTINVKIDKEVYSIGLNADVLKRIDGMFWVMPVFSKKIKDSYVPLVDLKLDTCKTDPTLVENPVIRLIAAEAKKFVSFGLMCPYEPGHYTVNDFTIDNNNAMMNFIPKGSYHVSINTHHQSFGSNDLNKVMSLSFYADFE